MELEVVTKFVHPFACFAATLFGHASVVVLEEDGGVEVVGGGGVVGGGFEGEDGAELTGLMFVDDFMRRGGAAA
jgi:hypothetical protein